MLQVEHQFSHFRAPSIKAPILWFSKLHSGSFFLLKFGCTRLPSVNVEIKRSLCSALTAAAQSSFKDGFFPHVFVARKEAALILFTLTTKEEHLEPLLMRRYHISPLLWLPVPGLNMSEMSHFVHKAQTQAERERVRVRTEEQLLFPQKSLIFVHKVEWKINVRTIPQLTSPAGGSDVVVSGSRALLDSSSFLPTCTWERARFLLPLFLSPASKQPENNSIKSMVKITLPPPCRIYWPCHRILPPFPANLLHQGKTNSCLLFHLVSWFAYLLFPSLCFPSSPPLFSISSHRHRQRDRATCRWTQKNLMSEKQQVRNWLDFQAFN